MAFWLTTFCIFLLSTFGRSSCFEWETLPENVVYSCVGRKVEFPWGFKADGAGLIRDIRWLFNGVFDSMMVAMEAYGYFLPTPPYSQRVRQLTNGGLELSDVTLADAGNYTVEVNMEVEGSLVSHRHSALLQVGDGLMTQGGTLTASQDPVALWDSSDHQWTIRLTCGLFTFLGQPPVHVIWTTPTMETTASSGYDNGHFYLTLSSPVKGGNYTCHIPHHLLSDVCVTESNHGNHRVTSSVLVSEVKARLSLLEAEHRTLNAKLSNLSSEIMELGGELQVTQTLTDESTDNLTHSISGLQGQVDVLKERRCESGKQGLDPYNGPVVAYRNVKRHKVHVRFSRPFSTQPWVSVSLSTIDALKTANLRVRSGASDVTTSGFNVYADQWHDTRLHSVVVSWIACNV